MSGFLDLSLKYDTSLASQGDLGAEIHTTKSKFHWLLSTFRECIEAYRFPVANTRALLILTTYIILSFHRFIVCTSFFRASSRPFLEHYSLKIQQLAQTVQLYIERIRCPRLELRCGCSFLLHVFAQGLTFCCGKFGPIVLQ